MYYCMVDVHQLASSLLLLLQTKGQGHILRNFLTFVSKFHIKFFRMPIYLKSICLELLYVWLILPRVLKSFVRCHWCLQTAILF